MLPIVPLSFFGETILASGILTLSFKEIIIGILLISLMFLYCFQITKGIANKHTANDNTSGVATLLAISQEKILDLITKISNFLIKLCKILFFMSNKKNM